MGRLELLSEHVDKDGSKIKVERDKKTGQRFISKEVAVCDCSVICGAEDNIYICNKCNVRIEKPSRIDWKCKGKCKEPRIE